MLGRIIDKVDVSYLDPILLNGGLIKPVPAQKLEGINQDHLMLWCVLNAVYQIPTIELIDWLRQYIGNKAAIEICAGKSGIGRALGIRATDSWMQTRPEVMAYYQMLKQMPVIPPGYVEKIDANDAVKKYDPQIVVGSFVTQRWLSENDVDGNAFGPVEEEWLDAGKTYIHIGNEETHQNKRVLSRSHKTFKFPWLRSRSMDQQKNVIWVWEP
jgi:hypothetical protein